MTRRLVRPVVLAPSWLRLAAVVSILAPSLLVATGVGLPVPPAAAVAPAAPPAAICGTSALNGPASAPAGAVVVPAGYNDTATLSTPGTTYWFAPGTHTMSPLTSLDMIRPGTGATLLGAPGAVLDGGYFTQSAIGGTGTGVTVRYLTVRHFGGGGSNFNTGVVNRDAATGWTIEFNTVTGNAGAGVLVGDSDALRSNCITNNGQYGFNVFKTAGVFNITVDHNEIAGNNADNWEVRIPYCGCSGADKLWDTHGAAITNNWIHDNRGPGVHVDTDNTRIQIEGNYIENNDAEAVVYETSYNGRIANNTFRRNAIVKGQAFAARGDGFAVPAVYLEESGGDARVEGGTYSTFEITANDFVDNWGGVTLFENADRFCTSPQNAVGYCTLGGAGSLSTCVQGTINVEPYRSDCRWKVQNVSVHDNTFRVDRAAIGCAPPSACAQQALFGSQGTAPSWSPYLGTGVQDAVTFSQNNRFFNNQYFGDWVFTPHDIGVFKSFSQWQAAPYNLDAGSTLGTTQGSSPPVDTLLDQPTTTAEGSIGSWSPWFGATVNQSTTQAYSGTGSLEVIPGGQFWGANLRNDPGFPAVPGPKNVSFFGLGGAGSNTSMGATLTVYWRNAAGANIQVDTLTLASLGALWTKAVKPVTAPPGTAFVSVSLSSGTGVAGAHLFFDDIVVSDTPPPAPGGALDLDTATLEGSIGHWAPWFGAGVARTTAQARTGSASLQVNVASQFWGANLNNDPGFPVAAGQKNVSFWGRSGAGAGTASGATLSVYWRNASGANLQVDTVSIPALSSTWAQAGAGLTAPAGTAKVSISVSGSTGVAGSTLYFDDFAITDPAAPPITPPGGLLDADTKGLEGSVGHWAAWFGATVARSTSQSHSGAASLQVAVTAPFGWGANLNNDPGFAATPGPKTVSFWGLAGPGSAAGIGATLTVYWRGSSGQNLQVDTATIPALTGTWTQGSTSVTAPAGTTKVSVALSNGAGGPGDTLYFDDIVIA